MNNYFENFDELLKELDLKNYVSFVKKCFKNGLKKNEETICAQDLRNLAKCLPRVSGVWYDLHKNSWEARWSEGTKSARKYYSVQKFGFHEARKLAIKTIKTKEINYLYNSINEDFNKPLKWNLNNEFLEMNHDPTINLKKKCRAKNCKIKDINVKKESNNINKKMKNEKKNNQSKYTKQNNTLSISSKKNEDCEIKHVKNTEKKINSKFAVKNEEYNRNYFNCTSEKRNHIKNSFSKESNISSRNNSETTSTINHIIIKDGVNDYGNQNDTLKYSDIYVNNNNLINKNNSDTINENKKGKSKENIHSMRKYNSTLNNPIINNNKNNNITINHNNSTIFNSNYINEIKNERNIVSEKNVIHNNITNQYYKDDKIGDVYNENNNNNNNNTTNNDNSNNNNNNNFCMKEQSYNEDNKSNLMKFPCEKILSYILCHNKPFSKNNFYNKQIDLLKINIKQTKNNPINKENGSISESKAINDSVTIKKLNSTDKNICLNKLNDNFDLSLRKNSEEDKNNGYSYYDNSKNIQVKNKIGNSPDLLIDTYYKGIYDNNDDDNNSVIFKNEAFSLRKNSTSKTLNNISKNNVFKKDVLKESNVYNSCDNKSNKKNSDVCNEKNENDSSCIKLSLKDSINSDTLSIFKNAINLLLKDLKYKCVPLFDKQFLNIIEIIDNHLSYVNSIFNENFLITYVHLFDICVSNNMLPSQMDQKIQKVFCNALIAFHILLFNFHKEKKN